MSTVLVPKTSPACSALGLLLSDHIVDEMRAYVKKRWTSSKLPGGVSRKARRLMAAEDGKVRARLNVIITRLRKV